MATQLQQANPGALKSINGMVRRLADACAGASNYCRDLSELRVADLYHPEQLDALRALALDTFGYIPTSSALPGTDPEAIEEFVDLVRQNEDEEFRAITFVGDTSVFITHTREAYDTCQAVRDYFLQLPESDAERVGKVMRLLNGHVAALDALKHRVDVADSAGLIPVDLKGELEWAITPVGPIDVGRKLIAKASRDYLRSRKDFIFGTRHGESYLIAGLTQVFLEQNPEAIRRKLDILDRLPDIATAAVDALAARQSALILSSVPGKALPVSKAAPLPKLSDSTLPDPPEYEARFEQECIFDYLYKQFGMTDKAVARSISNYAVTRELKLSDIQRVEHEFGRQLTAIGRELQRFDYTGLHSTLLELNPRFWLMAPESRDEYLQLLRTVLIQTNANSALGYDPRCDLVQNPGAFADTVGLRAVAAFISGKQEEGHGQEERSS